MDREILVHTGGGVLTAWVLDALRVRAVDVYPEVVDSYVEALREGAVLPPVQVVPVEGRYLLVDGRHRAAAWMAHGEGVRARVGETCSMAQAVQIALLANASHGHRRQAGDVTRCIEVALEVWPEESNRAIARRVGCCHTLVNRVVARQAAPPEVETVSTQEVVPAPVVGTMAPPNPEYLPDEDGYPVFNIRNEPAPWVEDVDRELASGEAEVSVAREVKRHRGQDPLERWYTPEAMAAVCWRWLLGSGLLVNPMPKQPWVLRLLEPCVGGGAWLTGLEVAAVQRPEVAPARAWTICDLDPEAPGLKLWRQRTEEAVVGDVTTLDFFGGGFDVAISNPPNSRALDVIMACLEVVRPGGLVVMLMPANWMAAKRRRAWLKMYPPEVVAWAPWRPSFEGPAAELQETDGGSPPQEYALHVWRVGAAPGVRWTGTWVEDFGSEEVGDGEE